MVAIPYEGLLILAIVLIAIGLILMYAPISTPVDMLGNIVFWIGILVFVIWVILLIVTLVRKA